MNGKNIIIVGILLLAIGIGYTMWSTTEKNKEMMPEEKMPEQTTQVGGATMYPSKDIVSNVMNAPNLTTLVAAVKAAGLVETLQSAGPFTVFGPDNAAFAKLPAGTLDTLLKPENKAMLAGILTYHVVSGKYTTADLKDGLELTTVQGQKLTVKNNGTSIMIMDDSGNTANVATADVMQSNGVAHVIDSVLIPQQTTQVGGATMYPSKDIVSNVINAPNLTTLVAAVKAAGLVETLQSTGPFTVFGPDNAAFAKLPAGTLDTLLKPENKAMLAGILTYHVVSGKYTTADLKDGQVLKTVQGGTLTVKKSNMTISLVDEKGNTSTIMTPDVLQKNGVAHVIDTVLMSK